MDMSCSVKADTISIVNSCRVKIIIGDTAGMIFYKRFYISRISVNFGTCTDSVCIPGSPYPPLEREPGFEDNCNE